MVENCYIAHALNQFIDTPFCPRIRTDISAELLGMWFLIFLVGDRSKTHLDWRTELDIALNSAIGLTMRTFRPPSSNLIVVTIGFNLGHDPARSTGLVGCWRWVRGIETGRVNGNCIINCTYTLVFSRIFLWL